MGSVVRSADPLLDLHVDPIPNAPTPSNAIMQSKAKQTKCTYMEQLGRMGSIEYLHTRLPGLALQPDRDLATSRPSIHALPVARPDRVIIYTSINCAPSRAGE